MRHLTSLEKIIIHGIFGVLFTYVILRAFHVFYIHDEIVSKYSYIINWRFIPYTGFIDANNHFLLSFLSGLIYRVSNSDHIFLMRLPSVLAFPVFYYSLVGFSRYLKSRASFFFLLLSICCTSFLLEFFSLARGYGLSFGFLIFAVLHTTHFFESKKNRSALLASTGWLLVVFSNLSLLPLALFGIVYLLVFSVKQKNLQLATILLFLLIPVGFAIKYALDLRDIGKLYLGEPDDFFGTTINSLMELMWNQSGVAITIAVSSVFVIIGIQFLRDLNETKSIFFEKTIFPIFLLVAVLSILLQNWLFGINYPENRAGAYLIIFFYGNLAFLIDRIKFKWLPIALTGVVLFLFILDSNLSHTKTYDYEHVDTELFTLIPDEVNGTPPSTGARFWLLDNELSKSDCYPLRAFQTSRQESDTLMDYIIQLAQVRPNILENYHILHTDPISKLSLYERNQFLTRTKVKEFKTEVNGSDLYFDLMPKQVLSKVFIRCKGVFYNMDLEKDFFLRFESTDSITGEKYHFGEIVPAFSTCINQENSITFDFIYTIPQIPSTGLLSIYISNERKRNVEGLVEIMIYKIP